MTDRLSSLLVVLEKDFRDDDAEPIIKAIGQIRGVLSVKARIADPDFYAAQAKAKHELIEKIWKVLS